MADTNEAPESRTLLLRRIAQLEDDLAETRGCIVRLASVIENLLIDGPHPDAGEADILDVGGSDGQGDDDWVAPVIALEPGRLRQDGAATGRGGAGRRLRRHSRSGEPQAPWACFIR
jgi:hypothetical protein